MKIIKYLMIFVLLIGLGVSAWLYYPQYQIHKIKKQAVAVDHAISYLDYYRDSAAAEINHLAIGDSIIHGVGARENENLVYQFSNKLGVQIHKKVNFQNEGINGLTSSELVDLVEVGRFDEEIRRADIITINVGGNDVLRTAENGSFQNVFQTFNQLQTTFSKNLSDITTRIRKLNPNATIVYLELYNPLPPDHDMYALADKLLPKWNLNIYEIASQFSSTMVVETTKVINGNNLQNLSPDGVHPNSSGYSAMSELIMDQFKQQYRKET